jgi:hypothetical protein
VQAAVLLGVAVGLVAGVDDRPLEGGLEADLLLEESARWVSWKSTGFPPVLAASLPTLPAPVKSWRETKCGMA